MTPRWSHVVTLTQRRAEVRDLVLRGRTVREIAAALGISVGTAKSHVSVVLRLEGAASMRELQSFEIARLQVAVDALNAEIGRAALRVERPAVFRSAA